MAALAAASLLLALSASAKAAFPGANGKIAFTREDAGEEGTSVHTVSPDGSGVSGSIGTFFYRPAWSPDGLRYAYDDSYVIYTGFGQTPEEDLAVDAAWSPDGAKIVYQTVDGITIANADGSGRTSLGVFGAAPAWSPNGTRIAFGSAGDVYVVDADGSNQIQLTTAPGSDGAPNWSPDGSKIAFASFRDGNSELYTMNPDGSGQARLTNTAPGEFSPAWSPDGTKIAHSTGNPRAIWYINADGTGATQVTNPNSGQFDTDPDWQPIPVNYPRPRGTASAYISLVPAYAQCHAPNRTHGAPLDSGSCAPPVQSSTALTLGTPDANGKPAASVAGLFARVKADNPATPTDESDVRLDLRATDVRLASDLSDFEGTLEARPVIRITDKNNTPSPGTGAATVTDLTFAFSVPCAATADPTGSTCQTATSANAVAPGVIAAGKRAIWQIQSLEVADETGAAYLRQGLFVP
jgi:hypothetical protein